SRSSSYRYCSTIEVVRSSVLLEGTPNGATFARFTQSKREKLCGPGRIRTSVGKASTFTACPRWPLEYRLNQRITLHRPEIELTLYWSKRVGLSAGPVEVAVLLKVGFELVWRFSVLLVHCLSLFCELWIRSR